MKKQAGMSLYAVMILVVVIVFLTKIGLSIAPMYWDHKMLQQIFQSARDSNTFGAQTSEKEVRRILESRLSANRLNIPVKDLEIDSRAGVLIIDWNYQITAPLIANLSVIGTFSIHEEFR